MPYTDILKRAWTLTWRYKILWLFGLLAGAGGGLNLGGGGGRGGSGSLPGGMREGMPGPGGVGPMVLEWLRTHAAEIVGLLILATILGIVLFVISFAARGGLVWLSAAADADRPVVAGDGWRVGFQRWGRVFGLHFLVALPIIAVVIVAAVSLGIFGVGAFAAWQADSNAGFGASIAGFIGLLVVFLPLIAIAGLAAALILELAVRHAVLGDRPVVDALGAAWTDLKTRFSDVFLMWLITLIAGWVLGFGILLVAGILLGPAIVAGIAAKSIGVGAALAIPGILVVIALGGAYGAWRSTVWTVFWRRLHAVGAPSEASAASGAST